MLGLDTATTLSELFPPVQRKLYMKPGTIWRLTKTMVSTVNVPLNQSIGLWVRIPFWMLKF
jgi:hypothetical protein